jgi:hypothetical protein
MKTGGLGGTARPTQCFLGDGLLSVGCGGVGSGRSFVGVPRGAEAWGFPPWNDLCIRNELMQYTVFVRVFL